MMQIMQQEIIITKSTGEKVPFSEKKLVRSLQRSGAGKDLIDEILLTVKNELHEGITTKEIYRTAYKLLKKKARSTAARYKLKNAIMELGPSGYPFEQFVAELLKYQGYQVKIGEIVEGHCVKHEVDVIADSEEEHAVIECKFHNRQGYYCDVKIPLYFHARFLDIEKKLKSKGEHQNKSHQGWIFTNTRFSNDAIQYANCVGLKLMGWDYPQKGNLKQWVDISGLHPITCLTTLTKAEKVKLLDKKIVISRDLQNQTKLLDEIGIHSPRKEKVLEESRGLCEKLIPDFSNSEGGTSERDT